jgi:REP element-mobilizing transposase RayT
MRKEVLQAMLSVAPALECSLLAAHVRETHVHVILSCSRNPQAVATALKSAATRRLRHLRMIECSRPIWADFLNVRYLRTREAILRALHYVVDKQGKPMALWHVAVEELA